MSFDSLLDRRVTILHRSGGTPDRYGNVVQGESSTDEDVPAYLEQVTSIEVLVGRDTVSSDHLAILGPTAVVDPTDQIVSDGVTYELVGEPAKVFRPNGGLHHVELRLRAVTG